jgi:hypothetical protein
MKAALSLTAVAGLIVATAVPVHPCCMVPATYEGTIQQSAQEAVLFHHDGREELILKINYKILGKTLPDRFAWVITVPSEPDEYQVADKDLFRDVFRWAEAHAFRASKNGRTLSKADGDTGLEIGKEVQVGPYAIVPVRARGREALGALNGWLDKNGFPKEDPRHMAYFVDNKFTFLCVKFDPRKGEKAVDREGGVPPLHLSFKSANPYYPLRFSSRQGVFDVNLYVLTKKKFDYRASSDSLKRIRWAGAVNVIPNVAVKPATFPKPLKDVYSKSRFKDDDGTWYLNVLRTKRVNEGNTIAKWTKDIFFKTQG